MRCPKCNFEVDENALFCPNCKKVLKLQCPVCKTLNKTSLCKKCGFQILSKCFKCGKINPTARGKCSNCGFDTYTSLMISDSNTDEFCCLIVDFSNLSDIKNTLGSTKLFAKFQANLDSMIVDYLESLGLRRQIVDSTYIIRFNKEYSFSASAKTALKSAIELLNLITRLNYKIKKLTEMPIRCEMALLQRDVNSPPDDYKSGFNIRMIYQNSKSAQLLNNLQLVMDQSVFNAIGDKYDISPLSAVSVKNRMVMFFEVNLKKYVHVPSAEEMEPSQEDAPLLPEFITQPPEEKNEPDKAYDIEGIDFNEIKCNFVKVKTVDLAQSINSLLTSNPKNIISLKVKMSNSPLTSDVLRSVEQTNIFKNIVRISCDDKMKFEPYGFFKEMLSGLYNYSISPVNQSSNDFSGFKANDSAELVKSLINNETRTSPSPEDVRFGLFENFMNLFGAFKDTLIYVENFEKVDETSFELLQVFFERFQKLNLSWLFVADETFSLHKSSHSLLELSEYTEISLRSSEFKLIPDLKTKFYADVIDSHYMQTIAQYANGSLCYFRHCINYLVDLKIFQITDDKLEILHDKTVVIPPNLHELFKARLSILKKDKPAFETLAKIVYLNPRVDLQTLALFRIPDFIKIVQSLTKDSYIYSFNSSIYVQNYNILRSAFDDFLSKEEKSALFAELLEKLFYSPDVCVNKALYLEFMNSPKTEFLAWENISRQALSLGDFNAYLNCSIKFLKLLDTAVDESSQKTVEEYKLEVYQNISDLLYKYSPEKISSMAKVVLDNFENKGDDKKIINLSNKILQGCLISGNYTQALSLVNKIMSKLPCHSINPYDDDFDKISFLVSLVKLEVLFNIGYFHDCIELGEQLFKYISSDTLDILKPKNFTAQQFRKLVADNLGFVLFSKALQGDKNLPEFIEFVENRLAELPASYRLFKTLHSLLIGENYNLSANVPQSDNNFGVYLFHILNAFKTYKNDYRMFAAEVYKAKLFAKNLSMHQMELFADLLIAYSYMMLNEGLKASFIFNNVLETSNNNGHSVLACVCWYLIALSKFKEGKFDLTQSILNNMIVQLEKNKYSNEFLLMLFKFLGYELNSTTGDTQKSELYCSQAKLLAEKLGLTSVSEKTS